MAPYSDKSQHFGKRKPSTSMKTLTGNCSMMLSALTARGLSTERCLDESFLHQFILRLKLHRSLRFRPHPAAHRSQPDRRPAVGGRGLGF